MIYRFAKEDYIIEPKKLGYFDNSKIGTDRYVTDDTIAEGLRKLAGWDDLCAAYSLQWQRGQGREPSPEFDKAMRAVEDSPLAARMRERGCVFEPSAAFEAMSFNAAAGEWNRQIRSLEVPRVEGDFDAIMKAMKPSSVRKWIERNARFMQPSSFKDLAVVCREKVERKENELFSIPEDYRSDAPIINSELFKGERLENGESASCRGICDSMHRAVGRAADFDAPFSIGSLWDDFFCLASKSVSDKELADGVSAGALASFMERKPVAAAPDEIPMILILRFQDQQEHCFFDNGNPERLAFATMRLKFNSLPLDERKELFGGLSGDPASRPWDMRSMLSDYVSSVPEGGEFSLDEFKRSIRGRAKAEELACADEECRRSGR